MTYHNAINCRFCRRCAACYHACDHVPPVLRWLSRLWHNALARRAR